MQNGLIMANQPILESLDTEVVSAYIRILTATYSYPSLVKHGKLGNAFYQEVSMGNNHL